MNGATFDPLLGQLRTVDSSSGTSPLTTKGDIYGFSTTDARIPVGADGYVLTADSTQTLGVKWNAVTGTGTVTNVSVVTANGVSGTVANSTTTPAITLALGAITPTSVNSVVLSGSSTPILSVTGTSSISGSNTGDQTITLTGDVTGSGTGSFATTLATVNSNVGSFTNASITVNAKGLITAASNGTAPVTSVTGTANRITIVGTTTPTIDIAATYVGQSSITTLGTVGTGVWQGTKVGLAYGGTNADLSATGGTSQVLKQTSSGAAVTVGQLAASDLSNGVTGSGSVVLGTAPTMSNPVVGTQSTTDNSTKAASTAYVTTAVANAVSGINPAVAVQAATTTASNTSGFTYNNGVSGVGATLTQNTAAIYTVDGYTFNTIGQRLLVKNDTQSPSGAYNGVYFCTTVGTALIPAVFTRATDYNSPSDINNTGAIPVINGTVNAVTSWLLTSSVTTVGTSPLTYTQFSYNPTSVIPPNLGGTGIANNASSTLAISGNFATTLTVTSATGVTLPTSGTLYGTASGSITSSQLATSVSDETGSGSLVFATSPTLVTPKIGSAGSINDINAKPLISFPATVTSPVNYIQVSPSVTGFPPTITATGNGTDTNIGLALATSGAGRVTINGVFAVTVSSTDNFTNKSIDATTNTLSNIGNTSIDWTKMPQTQVLVYQPTGTVSTTSSTPAVIGSFGTITLTKKMGSSTTSVLVVLQLGWANTSAAAVNFGVLIDGTNQIVMKSAGGSSVHQGASGSFLASGLAAGSHTFRATWATVSGTLQSDQNDTIILTISEVNIT